MAILGTYGIYLATRGKVKPKANPKPTPATTGQNNPAQEIKEFALDVFKKEGKFDKVRAILADGKKYTGNITAECKTDGSKVVMEYVDGVLQKSTKKAKDGTKVFEKVYKYENNVLSNIENNGEDVFRRVTNDDFTTTVTSKGYYRIDNKNNRLHSSKIEGQGLKHYYYSADNKLKAIKHKDDMILFYDDGKTIKTVMSGRLYDFYDPKGNFVDRVFLDGSVMRHNDFWYNECSINRVQDQRFELDKDNFECSLIREIKKEANGKKQIKRRFNLFFNEKNYDITKDNNVIKIFDSKENKFIEQNSKEYEEIIAQAKERMKELKVEYRKALRLKEQAAQAKKAIEEL